MDNELYFEIINIPQNIVTLFNKFYTSEKEQSIYNIKQIINHKLHILYNGSNP